MLPTSSVDRDRLLDWYEAWNRRDWECVEKYLSEHLTCEDVAVGLTLYGRREYMKYCREFAEAFPDGKIRIGRVIVAGQGFAVVEYAVRGTQKGHFGLFPPSDRKVTFQFCDILKIEAERIAHLKSYGDLYRPLAEMEHIVSRHSKRAA